MDDLNPGNHLHRAKIHHCPEIEENKYSLKRCIRHQKKNGDIILLDLDGNIIKFNGEKAELIVANDITEKSMYFSEIQEQNRKLSEIAWMQSHVIRAPLARIMGLVDLIQNEELVKKERDEMLNHVLDAANELDGVIRKITDNT
ncbi:MAG: hypothetical protein WKF89_16075 [Chitinophagaceae bacterium]